MFSSIGNSPAQQVPAWKRLGLKLKQPAASDPATGSPTGGVGHPSSSSPGKRKLGAPPATISSQVAKRPRRDDTQSTPSRTGPVQLKKQKSVTFADTPTKNANTPTGADSKTVLPKKSKSPAKKKQPPPTTDLKPALEYLRLWKTTRDSWKFNKNHQSALIKHVFDADGIPAADIDTFYDYIRDLKGFIRMRLRETALEIRTKDQADGKAGFPEGTKDVDAIQERYETILTRFLDAQQAGQKRKGFSETEYVSNAEDGKLVIQRLVKRLRAELVLDELSESDESGQTDHSTTSSSTETLGAAEDHTTDADADSRVKEFNDGTGKRRRKLRTANLDESSSEPESEDDSDTSSSGSSSDDSSEDEEDATTQQGDGYGTSSSSSSSSSESDSEDESGDESD